ncbi:hypothetical protein FSARC_2687 [Fusarium sarcochroum]|uniref:Uncharacterized protein n=1 Tax=Fusarium sarcochroum TaxID=1208366 RepID=A0A8H4U5P8_9HYPO|nr:hypothetical protein FSARC_2687 [Fusarium sarcochroum]
MVRVIHGGGGGLGSDRPRKLLSPQRKDKLVVSLKLHPSVLGRATPKCCALANPLVKTTDRETAHESLRKELDTYQFNYLNQLISEKKSELTQLNIEYSKIVDNVHNYEKVHNMHFKSFQRNLADAYESQIATCEPEPDDDEVRRFLKDDIVTLRGAVENWRRILIKAKQDASSKKHLMSIITKDLKVLEEELHLFHGT